MKIAWFTPFDKTSAIGNYSKLVTEALIAEHDIVLWINSSHNIIETNVQKVFYGGVDNGILNTLQNYDFIFYNMGNYFLFHKDIYEISLKYPGIVILHDYVMHHFFAEYFLEKQRSYQTYINVMQEIYGENGKIVAVQSLQEEKNRVWETDEVMKYPLFEKCIQNATAVITHSYYFSNKVNKVFPSFISTFYFPTPVKDCDNIGKCSSNNVNNNISKEKLIMLSIGHVNPNKRIDKIIDVFCKNKNLASKFKYIIIGKTPENEYFENIKKAINKHKLSDIVCFLGYQTEDVVYNYLNIADICINLRYPNTEGASWSLAEQLYLGKPVIATDTGFYSEIPDDCIIKISIDNELDELEKQLIILSKSDSFRASISKKAKEFARTNFSTEKYVQTFNNFLNELSLFECTNIFIDHYGIRMRDLCIIPEINTVDRVVDECYYFFNKA